MTGRIPRKNIQNVQLATKRTTRRCWEGAGAHIRPKNLKLDNSKTEETTTRQNDSNNNKPTTSILKDPKN